MQTLNTISGRPDSMIYRSYLYNRQMIFREVILHPHTLDTMNSSQIPFSNMSNIHQVRCCDYSKRLGAYSPKYMTTSGFIRHFQKHHPAPPSTEDTEKQYLRAIGVRKRKRTRETADVTPWTLTGGA